MFKECDSKIIWRVSFRHRRLFLLLLVSVWELSVQIYCAGQNWQGTKQEFFQCHRGHLHAMSTAEAAGAKDASSPHCYTATSGVKYGY